MAAVSKKLSLIIVPLLILIAIGASGASGAEPETAHAIFVPAYSYIYIGRQEAPFPLTITLSVRNVDATRTVTLTAVDYYDTAGRRVHTYLGQPVELAPGQSVSYIVKESEQASRSGIGVSFRIAWLGDPQISPPLAEAIMIGAAGQQGISFTSRGVPVSAVGP